jgi:hypothetical protein
MNSLTPSASWKVIGSFLSKEDLKQSFHPDKTKAISKKIEMALE